MIIRYNFYYRYLIILPISELALYSIFDGITILDSIDITTLDLMSITILRFNGITNTRFNGYNHS